MAETLTFGNEEMTTEEANRLFAAAMAAPEPEEEAAPAPKRREPKQPAEDKPAHSRPRVSAANPVKRAQKTAKTSETAKQKDYTAELEGLLQLAYGTCAATGNLADAGAIKTHGPGMVQAWNTAAQENSTIAKGLEWLTKGGVWGAVLMSTLPFALQVAANHGQVPIEKVAALGVKNPETLSKETIKDIEQMAQMAA